MCDDPHTGQYRHWSRERDDHILQEYGLPPGPHRGYEVDHLIPLDLGGADADSNLWPEPRSNIVEWRFSAEAKDKLEMAHARPRLLRAGRPSAGAARNRWRLAGGIQEVVSITYVCLRKVMRKNGDGMTQ